MITRSTISLVIFLTLALLIPEMVSSRRWTPAFGTRGVQSQNISVRRSVAATAQKGTGEYEKQHAATPSEISMTRDEQIALKAAREQSDTFIASDAGSFGFF